MIKSTKPYMIRAIYDWINDNELTPYILVNAKHSDVLVPKQYVQDGKITLNITNGIVQELALCNDHIAFDARFSGQLKHIYVPISAVLAIYARENGQGISFDEKEDESSGGKDEAPQKSTRDKKPHLRIVE